MVWSSSINIRRTLCSFPTLFASSEARNAMSPSVSLSRSNSYCCSSSFIFILLARMLLSRLVEFIPARALLIDRFTQLFKFHLQAMIAHRAAKVFDLATVSDHGVQHARLKKEDHSPQAMQQQPFAIRLCSKEVGEVFSCITHAALDAPDQFVLLQRRRVALQDQRDEQAVNERSDHNHE